MFAYSDDVDAYIGGSINLRIQKAKLEFQTYLNDHLKPTIEPYRKKWTFKIIDSSGVDIRSRLSRKDREMVDDDIKRESAKSDRLQQEMIEKFDSLQKEERGKVDVK